MADFLDHQAVESEGEGSSDTSIADEGPRLKKRKLEKKNEKGKKKKRQIDSSDEEDDDDDDEAKAAEEMKGFIADEEEEEEDRDSDVKSEKSNRELDELDEDDLDLIEENLDAVGKSKRIVQTFDSDEEEDDRTAIQRKLFGGGDDDEEPSSRRHAPEHGLSGSEEEGSEDNFIVNEGDGEQRKKRRHHKRDMNLPEGALDEARDIFGVEEFDLNDFYDEDEEGLDEEDEDILDEDGDGEPIRRVRKKEKKGTIYDTMDPVELERGFFSAADKKIMYEDKPERFQTRRTEVREVDEAELEIETKWMVRYAFTDDNISKQKTKLADIVLATSNEFSQNSEAQSTLYVAIREALRYIRNDGYEVTFILAYRKETTLLCLSARELYKIFEYDEKWCHVQDRKYKIMELMKRMQRYQMETQSAKEKVVSEMDIHELHSVDTEEALADHYSQFSLYHGPDVGRMLEWEKVRKGDSDPTINTKFKYSSRTDRYQFCLDNGIGEFANRFGLTARQFGENLDWKRHEVEQDPMTVDEVTEEYVSSTFPDRKNVLESGIFMVAKELSRQPLVREKVRRAFIRRATMTVRPTKIGRNQLDDSHPCYKKRYVKNMPIKELQDEEFLYFYKLKEAGLITLAINCDTEKETDSNETLADEVLLDGPYKKDDYTDLVEEWNKIRELAVKKCVNEMLIPHFREELEKKLIEEAKNCVAEKCGEALAKRIETTGFRPMDMHEEEDLEFTRMGEIRVMAIAYPDDMMEASFGAIVNEDGQMLDYVRMVHFLKRDGRFADQPRNHQKKETMDLFKKMVERKRPHIIGLCAESLEATRLKKDLEQAIGEMLSQETITQNIEVAFIECDAAKVFMNSKQAITEFPDYPPILRMAISAARFMVDPLIEISSFWNPEEDILCIPFHPLQKEVNKERLFNAFEKEMMKAVCEVGVDVNRCIDNPHHANLIQFIAGLGPRKAYNLLKEIRQTTHILGSRTALVTHAKMGPKVFMNCAGFIKIEQQRISDRTDEYFEVLDASRVHPETYEWARKMAVDALEVDDSVDPQSAIEELLNAPERLKDLDLDAFAEELNRQGFGEKRAALYDIAKELHERYKDRRKPFEPMSVQDLHEILIRDMKETLKEGKLVQATVVGVQHKRLSDAERENTNPPERDLLENEWVCQFCHTKKSSLQDMWDHIGNKDSRTGGCLGIPVGVKVRLENGFQGFIPSKMISDNFSSFKHPLERVQIGRMLWCRVMKVDLERMSILLSCRTSDLRGEDASEKAKYWDIDAEQQDKENDLMEKRRRAENTTVIKRVIQHHAFQNISYQDAIQRLSKGEQGECIIRPSSKSADRLTATWKVAEGVYANVDIQENEKENVFSLGRKLIINGEDFEDLNEIIARYISPMASFARDIVLYKYYLDSIYAENRLDIEQKLKEERRLNPSRIPYVLTASTKFPGKFQISFAHPKYRAMLHEYMTVTPEGIRFRQRVFNSFDQLLNWFKAHFNEMPPSYR